MQSVEREQSSSSSSAHDPAARRHLHPDSYHTTEEEEPSVDVLQQPSFQYNASLHPIDTITTPTTPSHVLPTIDSSHSAGTTSISPFFSAGLRLQTDAPVKNYQPGHTSPSTSAVPFAGASLQDSGSKTDIPVRSSSIRSTLSATAHHRRGSLSPASVVSSPGFDPAVDVTPLPSPITSWGSPGQWRRVREKQGLQDRISDPPRDTATAMTSSQGSSGFSLLAQEGKKPQISHVPSSVDNRDAQGYDVNADAHARNQGVGNDISNHVQVPGYQNMDFSSSRADLDEGNVSSPTKHLHREEYLAVKRGLALPMPKPLTPPRSNRDTEDSDLGSPPTSPSAPKRTPIFYEARTIRSGKLKRWREIGYLGGGAFSTVVLATSEDVVNNNKALAQSIDVFSSPAEVSQLDPKRLVAIKICEHGPAGGADEKRVEMSLERELDILKSIDHPSLAHLKAVNIMDQRAFLVLGYCPGGDLYFLAESKTELLIPSLVRRIFAELVAAARHLHSQYIVHRDIKLENVLVNLPADAISAVRDWQTYPSSVVTLTDLGLGRRIPQPPESPLLETRCGSEDYTAPEIILGDQYDGRATDAWALGVLLYALMENRLPFDELPETKRSSQKLHRIARCDWRWVKWADAADMKWDPRRGEAWEGARRVVEALLTKKRSRWGLDKVSETEWVGEGILLLDAPLRRIDDDDDDDDDDDG